MKICVLGLGYIGLPTASLLATKGMDVLGVDIRQDVVATINEGNIHIHEPDLDILVKSAVHSGKLTASLSPAAADVFIIAVPTPFRANHEPDLSYVEQATRSIAKVLAAGNLIILESTSPVGTTEKIAGWLSEARPDLEFFARNEKVRKGAVENANRVYLAHCPERVLPGKILKELVDNDRIIGGIDMESTKAAATFYGKFVSGQILKTNARTAELAKLTENSYRDVNIAFANELSMICDKLKIDVWELIELANRHPRVSILQPGAGVGGHCIAVDPWFIVHSAPEQARLIGTARQVNDSKPDYVVKKIVEKAERLKRPKIACLGLAFKANLDDLRESPALYIVEELAKKRVGEIFVVEPHIDALPKSLAGMEGVTLCDFDKALAEADILALLVDHRQFKLADRSIIVEKMVIDTRGLWRAATVE